MERMIVRRLILTLTLLGFISEAYCGSRIKLWEGVNFKGKYRWSELTVYTPDPEKSKGIGVVICPGGSYTYLGMNHEGHEVAEWLNQQGITAFVLRYRVALQGNHYPAMIEDLQRAIQIARLGAGRYGIDPNKIGVMGFSAGGHLAGMQATYFDRDYLSPVGLKNAAPMKPAFVAMIYPVVSMEDGIAHRKSRRSLLPAKIRTDEMLDMLSLEKNARKEMPPVFITTCRDDRTVDYNNSVKYSDALRKAGAECALFIYDRGDHGFGLKPKYGDNDWPEQFLKWLDKILSTNEIAALKEGTRQ